MTSADWDRLGLSARRAGRRPPVADSGRRSCRALPAGNASRWNDHSGRFTLSLLLTARFGLGLCAGYPLLSPARISSPRLSDASHRHPRHPSMSSPEEDYDDGSVQNAKKRRIQRACDMCRRKKSTSSHLRARRTKSSDDPPLPPQSDVSPRILSLSCPNANQHVRSRPIPVRPFPGDGAQMPNNRCSNCVSYRLECTYVEAAKVRPTMLPPSPARAQLPTEARPSQGVRTLLFPARVTR